MLRKPPEEALKIVSIVVLGDRDEATFLAVAASLARAVDEDLGSAILEFAPEGTLAGRQVEHLQSIAGKGVAGSVNGRAVALGTSSFLSGLGLCVDEFGKWAERMTQTGQRIMFLAVDGQPAGFLRLSLH